MSELIQLPTKKSHISFSEFQIWNDCSYRHKLKYIDGIDLGAPNEYSAFGTAIHASCQKFIETRDMDKEIAIKILEEEWGLNNFENIEEWMEELKKILEEIPDFMEKEFPNWEAVKAEELINEEIVGGNIKLKGYIDAVIKIRNKKGKELYVLIDWKSSVFGWRRQKKQDFITKSQLIYYKNIWSKKHNVDLKDIRCAFVILKRKVKDGKRCELFPVSVGEKTSERAFKNIGNMVFNLMNDRFFKNRTSCEYCEFKDTDYCKNWIQMKLK